MTIRLAGVSLVLAAGFFWTSWALMPGVGITDAARILEIVGENRDSVRLSVVLQLMSAALYAPALVWLVAWPAVSGRLGVTVGAILLLIGAMGSAADAIYHLLAHAMTAEGLRPDGDLLEVMKTMQGPDLVYILPMVAAYFIGAIWLSVVMWRLRIVPVLNPALHAIGLATAIIGGLTLSGNHTAARIVGLTFLALVSAAQIWIGAALARRGNRLA